jgi:hypothetical protein
MCMTCLVQYKGVSFSPRPLHLLKLRSFSSLIDGSGSTLFFPFSSFSGSGSLNSVGSGIVNELIVVLSSMTSVEVSEGQVKSTRVFVSTLGRGLEDITIIDTVCKHVSIREVENGLLDVCLRRSRHVECVVFILFVDL